ncbi:YCE I like family protein [Bdellovibrio bacteriovorus]|uniref:YCE I like family protein n=1 Tax=Bdellovibrio bacteriovorus TaxID=959 RepID=A0A150WJP9_BDEBC|nr:YceI family protein [Bdellovibrio bacteriovorus]KYG63936.1 YCE I like family protein [Bdellovibrio bacteriovorus]
MMKYVLSALLTVAASAAMADVYKIDAQASKIAWKGTKKMGSAHNGHIAVKEGEVTTDKKNQITAGTVVVDMTTITNEDLKDSADYQKKLVGHLSSEDFFNVSKYPTSTFKITSVKPGKAKDEVIVKGDLTMIGGTHPVEFPATVKVDKNTITGTGKVEVDRTKWGLKYGSGNFFKELAGDKIINDKFELELNLVAKK